ncbi:MAG: CARDB domain-containing protein [Candidatus Altiarchaeota archaeon]
MRPALILALIVLSSMCASAQEISRSVTVEPPIVPMKIVSRLTESFCTGVDEGGNCNIFYPMSEDISGVCCGGRCMFRVSSCSKESMVDDKELYGILQSSTCREVSQGGDCMIPESVSKALGQHIWGICCDKLCRFGIISCRDFCGDGYCTDHERASGSCMEDCGMSGSRDICGDGYCSENERLGNCHDDCGGMQEPIMPGQGNEGKVDLQEQMKALEFMSCLGVDEGQACKLPEELNRMFDLTGVCCGRRCNYRKASCDKERIAEKPDLIISSIDLAPEDPAADDKVNVTVTAENVGEAPTGGAFWILIKTYDGNMMLDEDSFKIEDHIGPGDSIKHTFTGKLGLNRVSSFRFLVEADKNPNFGHQDNLVDEADEENNQASKTIFVRPYEDNQKKSEERFCGDGLCEEFEKGSCHDDCGMTEDGLGPEEFMVVIGLLVIAILAVLFLAFRYRKPNAGRDIVGEIDVSIDELIRKRDEIREMTAIARKKYHRRELDEESFREIVRDNQMKIIHLELKIKEMGGRIDKLEQDSNNKD